MKTEEFIKVFTPLCCIYNREPTGGLIQAWYVLLGKYEYRHLSVAIEAHMREDESGFFPMPSKIIKRVDKVANNLLEPEEAFMVVKEIMNHNNVDTDPYAGIDCPVMLKACKAVGWRAFDRSDSLDFAKRSFISQYESASKPGAIDRMKSIEGGGSISEALGINAGNLFKSVEQ